MVTLWRGVIFFLKDLISFIIYITILVFFRKRHENITFLYHSVGYVNSKEDPYRLNIFPEVFDKHLKVISKYRDKIEITFDDGFGNNFENVFPTLKKYNLNATIFLVTDFIDGKFGPENFAGKSFKERPLTWEEIRIMDRTGIKFGSHSKTHSLLTKLSKDELGRELIDSKRRIEEMLGHKIDSFAYPFGGMDSFNDQTREVLMEAKYNCAYTNIMGRNPANPSDKFTIRRTRVYRDDGPFKLRMKISSAYDWVDKVVGMKRIKTGCD